MNRYIAVVLCAGILQGCTPGPESTRGFRLPEGNARAGLQAFQDLECHACHDVQGLEPPAQSALDTRVALGGQVTRVRTYAELVTSIINPSHKLAPGYPEADVTEDGQSRMESAYLNEVMTVRQLIDIVTYLQPLYEVKPPEYDPYSHIYR